MTEKKATVVGGDIQRTTISDEIIGAVRDANERIDQLDTDPIIRLALARVAVRSFAEEIVSSYPEHGEDIAAEFESVAESLRTNENLPAEIRQALNAEDETAEEAATDGETDAEDQGSGGSAGGRGKANSQGGGSGGSRRKGARDNGAERVRKEHAILRVGGS